MNTEPKQKKLGQKLLTIGLYIVGVVVLLSAGIIVAMQLGLTNVRGSIDALSEHFNILTDANARKKEAQLTVSNWTSTIDWNVIRTGFKKDKTLIDEASKQSGVSSRLIISTIIVEQFRYFNSNREIFKKFLQPLEVLGNATKFSYGVAGIKIGTAKQVEANLKDSTSPYYLGPAYEHLLDFKTSDPDTERMNRLIDPNNHYYSYLYTALLLKEEMAQWKNAGHPIDNRPEILATLFNLGFAHSNPNANPQVGGATITINGHDYTFGGLAFDFYYSDQLTTDFPN